MSLLLIGLLAFVPTLTVEPQAVDPATDPTQLEAEGAAIADEIDRRIVALTAATESQDEAAIETSATRLLEITNLDTQPLELLGNDTVVRALHGLRGWAFWSLNRIEEADAAFEQAGPEIAVEFGYLAFRHDLAWEQRDWPRIMEILEADAIVSGPDAAIIRLYPERSLDVLRGGLGYGEANGRVAELLIATGWGADLPPGEIDWVFLFAAQKRDGEGDESGAREALGMMRNPTYIVDILLDTDLAKYHAQIEAQHGADLGRGAQSLSSDLEALWDERNEDAVYLLNYLISLRNLGRWQQIADQFGPIVDNFQRSIANGEFDHILANGDGYFVVNYLADAELRLGRYDSAISRMDSILQMSLEDNPDLINQSINRLEMLLESGDYEEVLRAARALEQVDDIIVAPYGRMLIRSYASCAAYLSGDSETATNWRDQLLGMDDPHTIIVLDTFLCLQDSDAAIEHVLGRMREGETFALRAYFQDLTLWEPRGDHDRLIKQGADELLTQPEIRRALDETGGIRRFALAFLTA